jgi:hypothetical protein
LPEERYHSTRLQGNVSENTANSILRQYKYITRLGDTPDLIDKYMVWGTAIWAWENQGLHGQGWMYNLLYLNDQVRGTYTLEPLIAGLNANGLTFPSKTFMTSSGIVQKVTENNKYDPKTQTLILYYKDVMSVGNDMIDILTYMGDEEVYGPGYTKWTWPNSSGKSTYVQNWEQVRSKGYIYWLPIGGE